jgi:perosamine synthetase
MISYGKQTIDKDDIDAIINVLKGDWLTQGPAIDLFEQDLCDYFGSKYACAVSNGTTALHLAALALGWSKGDIILTTPITFLASVNCIYYVGATPDFIDIHPESYTIDTEKLELKIKDYIAKGKKVKAVIGVDYAGHPCDWKKLREIADTYNVQLVNDNCHAMGAAYDDNKQYAVKSADVVTQSYHPVKHITTGEGGAILTNDSTINNKVRILRSHGMTKDNTLMEENHGSWYYEMHEPGYNYRITDFQCALGSSQLKKLDRFIDLRTKVASHYNKRFKSLSEIILPKIPKNIKHAFHIYPIQIDFDRISLSKVDFFNEMKNLGINLQVHYIPVHLQPFYRIQYKFKNGDFPVAESYYKKTVSIPIYPSIKVNEVNKVISDIKSLLEN